jgi:hypothetical protein
MQMRALLFGNRCGMFLQSHAIIYGPCFELNSPHLRAFLFHLCML